MMPYDVTPRLIERFDESYYVDQNTGCWNWLKRRDRDGYGIFALGPHPTMKGWISGRALRVSYELFNNLKLPDDPLLCIRHTCNNTSCVNPDHLLLGTRKENTHDAMKAGTFVIGSRHKWATITEKTVVQLKKEMLRNPGRSIKDIAEEYGISKNLLYHIRNNKSWKSVQI